MSYDSEVAADSAIRYYILDETSGSTAVDSGSQAQNGTHSNSPTLSANGATYNGTNQSTTLPTTGLPSGNSAYTVEFMVTPNSVSGQRDVCTWGTNVTNQATATGLNATNFWNYWNGSNVVTSSNPTAATGTEYHVAITYDQSNVTIFVQGTQRVQTARTSHNTVLGAANIGVSLVTNNWFNGKIRRVAIYNTALSATRIAVHYTVSASVATLVASGTMTVGGTLTEFAVASLTAASTFVAAATIPTANIATMTASSTFTAAGTSDAVSVAALTTVSTLTVAGVATGFATAALSATSTLTSAGSVPPAAAANLSATATFGASGSLLTVTATLVATSTFGASGLDDDLTIGGTGDLQIAVLDDRIKRAPSSITVVVDGGRPQMDVNFYLDGLSGPELVLTTSLDTSGGLQPTSITITGDVGGAQGTRTVTVQQAALGGGTDSSSATYEVVKAPAFSPTIQGPDTDPVEIPEAVDVNGVRHWVLQDLLGVMDGGIGSYVMPINPTTMTSPHLEFALKTHHTTAIDGMFHIFQAGNIPKEWTFTGVADTQEFVEQLEAYRNLNRRFWIIDHHDRAWKVAVTGLDIVPRLRLNWNGELVDWFTDYTMSVVVLDQDWSTPA